MVRLKGYDCLMPRAMLQVMCESAALYVVYLPVWGLTWFAIINVIVDVFAVDDVVVATAFLLSIGLLFDYHFMVE